MSVIPRGSGSRNRHPDKLSDSEALGGVARVAIFMDIRSAIAGRQRRMPDSGVISCGSDRSPLRSAGEKGSSMDLRQWTPRPCLAGSVGGHGRDRSLDRPG
jgi:hypothetical protein